MLVVKYDFCFGVFLMVFSLGAIGKCQEGTKLILDYDQKAKTFTIDHPSDSQVCHWIKEQVNSNVQVQYFNNGKLVFEHSLLFPVITIHEEVTKEAKLRPHAREESFLKIVNIPVERKSLQTFKVIDLMSKKLLSAGNIE